MEPAQTGEQRKEGPAPTVQELEHRLAFERLVMSVSTRFINSCAAEIDAGIEQSLRAIFVNALERQRADGQRRMLEEQLVQARSMENVARLAGGVAHDLPPSRARPRCSSPASSGRAEVLAGARPRNAPASHGMDGHVNVTGRALRARAQKCWHSADPLI